MAMLLDEAPAGVVPNVVVLGSVLRFVLRGEVGGVWYEAVRPGMSSACCASMAAAGPCKLRLADPLPVACAPPVPELEPPVAVVVPVVRESARACCAAVACDDAL